MWRKGYFHALLVGLKIGAATMVNKKLKIELPYNPATPPLGIYPKKMKILSQKDIYTPMFILALFTIAKLWKLIAHQWMSG